MKVAVIADSHTMGGSRPLPAGAWPFVETADHILHAGDVCDPTLLDELAAFAPVTVVMGNCDSWDVREWGATDEAIVTLDGVRIALVHDAGPSKGRRQRLRRRFPDARAVVYGHSHLPLNDDDGDLLLFNPGSPTWRRKAATETMGTLWIEDAKIEGDIFPV